MASAIKPEDRAREKIDKQLIAAGWAVQSRDEVNLSAARGVAVREFKMAPKHGIADYLLFVDGEPVGALEAKKKGFTLSGVEGQAAKYSEGLPMTLDAPVAPLPFLYLSTGVETQFINLLDPHPRSRRIYRVHQPETVAEWMQADPLPAWVAAWKQRGSRHDQVAEPEPPPYVTPKPSSLRARLRHMPPVEIPNLWPNKVEAITNLEESLHDDKPRALVQMATGSGKTLLAVSAIYRLIKYAGARRVLFLVDRKNLGEQTEAEFAGYRTPDDNRKFNELYNVQLLAGNTIGSSSKVVITTIQRLYSMLRGEGDLDPELEEGSAFEEGDAAALTEPVTVGYNPALPPEFFDVIFIDECHRSIYSLWRQVLEYFDAYLIGLTATPAKHTFGFFNRNLVMEYNHERAVADNINVDFEIYNIHTRISKDGSTIKAGPATMVGVRDRRTRALRWEQPDEDVTYEADELDRRVVAKDQIRLIVRTFKEKLFTEIFPGRREVPKTLIFAKDDSHAEDIVQILREEFGRGNQFCTKITYKATEKKPRDLIHDFRTIFSPRIAVTVDMISTGTDIKPIEIVMLMRSVKSRGLFEQMKGRGVRTIDREELKAVTPDAVAKTHFVLIDCVGIAESDLADTQPLERHKYESFKSLLDHVAVGGTDPGLCSTLASRLSRLDKQCGPEEQTRIEAESGRVPLSDIAHDIVTALDPDVQIERARQQFGLGDDVEPNAVQFKKATKALLKEAVESLATRPKLRKLLLEIKGRFEQIIDEVSLDSLVEVGASPEAREKARALVQSFEAFLEENKDEIDALQFFYSRPYRERLRFADIKALAAAIQAPPRSWTPERLWRAYESLDESKVRGASGQRLLTDVVSLVRFALHQEEELVPFGEQVRARFEGWIQQQENKGRLFTEQQTWWLEMIRDHVASSLEIGIDDFGYTPFVEQGGLGRVMEVFGTPAELRSILDELNKELAA